MKIVNIFRKKNSDKIDVEDRIKDWKLKIEIYSKEINSDKTGIEKLNTEDWEHTQEEK